MNQGYNAEQAAKQYLQQQGLIHIAANVRYKFGEIDLIMRDADYWVFIEVKYRSSNKFGGAIHALTQKQVHRIRKAAEHYLQLNGIDAPCRFDVIAIDPHNTKWICNAF